MATNILMPALSPTMTEGTLSRWLKKEGENVKAGDVIAEIETDKATMEVEAVDEGVLGKILVADGTEGVKVNEPIAVLVDQGEAVPAAAPAAAARRAAPCCAGSAPPKAAASRKPAAADGTAERQRARCRRRAHLRLAAGAADGEAGRHRSRGAEGQRAERAHRARRTSRRRCRRAPPAAAAAGRRLRRARCTAVRADRRAAHAGAAQHDAQGDRPAADRGEVDHPAFLRLDGHRDRRADQADERAEREVAEGGAGRVSDHHQRPGDQGRRPRRCAACRR